MTAEEIAAATDEMLARLDRPDAPETPAQEHFRDLMRRFAANGSAEYPLADYIGYALPECRVSDAVCRMRPGYLDVPRWRIDRGGIHPLPLRERVAAQRPGEG